MYGSGKHPQCASSIVKAGRAASLHAAGRTPSSSNSRTDSASLPADTPFAAAPPPKDNFLLVRYGRDVIKDAPMRHLHLLGLPRGENTCPIQELFYRRCRVRIVGPGKDLAEHP
jgi:hypothetical protein